MIDIMKFIKKERLRQGITQSAVAYAAMIDPATLCMWEHYKYSPKFEPIISILDFLGYEIVIKKKEQKEIPHTCETCSHDHDNWFDKECDSCCDAHSNWQLKNELQTEREGE